MTPVVEIVLKASALLALAAVAAAAAGRSTPAARHAIWLGTFAALLALPLAVWKGPRWTVALLPATGAAPVATPPTIAGSEGQRADAATSVRPADVAAHALPGATPAPERPASRWPSPLVLAWAIGVVACGARLVVGHVAVARLGMRARVLDTPRWRELLRAEAQRAGVREPVRLLAVPAVETPVTWGIVTPVVALPPTADAWPALRQRLAVRHELAHVARRDTLTQLLAGIACALYWFHPGVWLAARRLRVEREHACDDRVLAGGCDAPEYAAQLVDIARAARRSRLPALVTVSMARPSELERRVVALLDPRRPRGRLTARRAATGVALASSLVAALAAFRPVPTTPPIAVRPPVGPNAAPPTPTLPPPQVREDSTFERTLAAAPGGTLTLDLRTGGAIDVRGWDERAVSVRSELRGTSWRETRVTIEQDGDGVRVVARFEPGTRIQSTSHRFVVRVPRRYDVRIASAGGGVTIHDVEGQFTGSTGGGEILVSDASGRLALTTGGGAVRVWDSHLAGTVSTGGGEVRIERVDGGLRGSSGSGDVTYSQSPVYEVHNGVAVESRASARDLDPQRLREREERRAELEERIARVRERTADRATDTRALNGTPETERPIRVSRTGGTIEIADAPHGAELTTAGGEIRVGRARGFVSATTGGGGVTLGPVDGSATATTGSGDVSITIVGAGDGEHDVEVTSGTGTVDLYLPADISARLELESAYTNNRRAGPTRIVSDWSIPITTTDRWDDGNGTPRKFVRSRATLGSGRSLIRVRTVNGDVRIHTIESGRTYESRLRIYEE